MLTANFRNSHEATRVANQLLKIKQRRFGSIDRESNFLVRAVGGEAGEVTLVSDKGDLKRELDQKIRQSTRLPCWSCATRTRSRRASISDAAVVLNP